MKKYIEYSKGLECNENVVEWVKINLKNYLSKNQENQSEIEHIIDYLNSEDSPKRINKMSYKDALLNTNKWVKKLTRQGREIKESKSDTEIVLKLENGFKWVKLKGKNAFKREGFLMRHCVSSYYGKDVEVYSLRDNKNNPHCTVEKDKQIKGKGNGNIHPRYVDYVVKFLEFTGMTIGDNEMLNLGYINIDLIKEDLSKDDIKKSYKGKYLPKDHEFRDSCNEVFWSLDFMSIMPIIDIEMNINIPLKLIGLGVKYLLSKIKSRGSSKFASSGCYSQLAASGDYSKLAASGDFPQLAASGYSSKLAASGYYSQLAASGDYSNLAASGYHSKLAASGDYSKLASSGNHSNLEMEGENSVGANIGFKGKIKGRIGSWITLAEYDIDNNPLCVKSVQIDGKKIKENTWYVLKNRKFTIE